MTKKAMSNLQKLIKGGAVEECPVCGGYSAYAWNDVDDSIAHIPTSSCWEWECGHCGAHLVLSDAPILAECYTHIPMSCQGCERDISCEDCEGHARRNV